jgi:anti-sigma B factor antagonist
VDLSIRPTTIAGRAVVGLSGEIDLATLPRLHDALMKALSTTATPAVIVDLDGVYVCDDAALGVLLGAAGRARGAGGDMVVVCSDGALRDRLASTGFDRAVEVVATTTNAIDIIEHAAQG